MRSLTPACLATAPNVTELMPPSSATSTAAASSCEALTMVAATLLWAFAWIVAAAMLLTPQSHAGGASQTAR